jgi:hypothetical protein
VQITHLRQYRDQRPRMAQHPLRTWALNQKFLLAVTIEQ